MSIQNESLEPNCGYLEVFSTQQSGKVFGHGLIGAKPGPQLLVTACDMAGTKAFERLLKMPTMPSSRLSGSTSSRTPRRISINSDISE
ncbi:MAG: hypothetical protein CMF72_04825 [Mameliella sp.]|nr:hypothetical protein [Mameliella sp.]